MNPTTIGTAAAQYANRPEDERFPSLDAMVQSAQYDKDHSKEVTYNLKELTAQPQGNDVVLASPKGTALFTNWSFGNLSRIVGAPAAYLRKLPAKLASDNLNFGLQSSIPGSTSTLLVKANGGQPTLRAASSETYGRVWDADLYAGVRDAIKGDQWGLPPTWDGKPAGAYRGDRDSFLIYTNGGSIVTDPTAGKDNQMYRGLLFRNSEVGAAAIVIEAILYRYVCGNHNLWGAVVDKSFRRKHVGVNALRDTIREVGRLARDWANRGAEADVALIRLLASRELASTEAGLIDELMAMGATKADAKAAYDKTIAFEGASPRSFWGIAQGLTRLSQDTSYQDERFELDKLAMQVLKKGRELVAA
jgi:hypothetical protein